MPWIPRVGPSAQTLHPGVPPWLEEPLQRWADMALLSLSVLRPDPLAYPLQQHRSPIANALQEFDLLTHRAEPLAKVHETNGARSLRAALREDDDWLEYIDFLAYKMREASVVGHTRIHELKQLLTDAGSEWTVGEKDGHSTLVKRVHSGVVDSARAVMTSQGASGVLLTEAWTALYGTNPDPEEAYEKAIKAVEEAGAEKVAPNDAHATLGKMISQTRDQRWVLPLSSADASVPTAMMRALWQSQESRHGGNSYRKPTLEEAEAAVLLAVPLVQWFRSGVFRRP